VKSTFPETKKAPLWAWEESIRSHISSPWLFSFGWTGLRLEIKSRIEFDLNKSKRYEKTG
jgi:hypothetical protein